MERDYVNMDVKEVVVQVVWAVEPVHVSRVDGVGKRRNYVVVVEVEEEGEELGDAQR